VLLFLRGQAVGFEVRVALPIPVGGVKFSGVIAFLTGGGKKQQWIVFLIGRIFPDHTRCGEIGVAARFGIFTLLDDFEFVDLLADRAFQFDSEERLLVIRH
jgi:hypothetical protein